MTQQPNNDSDENELPKLSSDENQGNIKKCSLSKTTSWVAVFLALIVMLYLIFIDKEDYPGLIPFASISSLIFIRLVNKQGKWNISWLIFCLINLVTAANLTYKSYSKNKDFKSLQFGYEKLLIQQNQDSLKIHGLEDSINLREIEIKTLKEDLNALTQESRVNDYETTEKLLKLEKMNSIKDKYRIINQAVIKMKNDSLKGMHALLDIHNKSSGKIKDSVMILLDELDIQFKSKQNCLSLNSPDWPFLKTQEEKDFEHYKVRLMGENTTVNERTSILCQINNSFGVNFKIYEVKEINKWFKDNKHIELINQAKNKTNN